MIRISLVLNLLVLVPVCLGLLLDLDRMIVAFGSFSSARGILLSVYLAITLMSAWLLISFDPKYTVALLLIQVLYKITTPLTVGTFQNPVVISNLAIIIVHTCTLYCIFKNLRTHKTEELTDYAS